MDIEHYFIEMGHGEPLILLHGNGENCDYFKGQVDEFALSWHVFALDTRGHGKTSRGTAPFTIRQFADDLLAFMDAQGIGKAHVLGFSDSSLFLPDVLPADVVGRDLDYERPGTVPPDVGLDIISLREVLLSQDTQQRSRF